MTNKTVYIVQSVIQVYDDVEVIIWGTYENKNIAEKIRDYIRSTYYGPFGNVEVEILESMLFSYEGLTFPLKSTYLGGEIKNLHPTYYEELQYSNTRFRPAIRDSVTGITVHSINNLFSTSEDAYTAAEEYLKNYYYV